MSLPGAGERTLRRNLWAQLGGSRHPETFGPQSVNLERKPFSVLEFLGGGIALATIALIAFGGLRVAQPRNSLPAPTRYASVSIQSSEALAKLSLEQPRELSDVAGATRDVQSPDTRLGTGNSTPIESNGAKAPRPPVADRSAAPAAGWPVGLRIRQRGIEADSLGVFTDVISGPPLPDPLRDSRLANSQRRNVPDSPGVRADSNFIGGWTDDIGRCRTGRKAPLVISSRAAKTANGECDFGFVAREAANRWRVTAICAAGENFWRANIALKLMEPNLTWSSERGTETYVRCKRRWRSGRL
jgi:hypothetical protein